MSGTDKKFRQILRGNFQPIRTLDSANQPISSRVAPHAKFVEIFLSVPDTIPNLLTAMLRVLIQNYPCFCIKQQDPRINACSYLSWCDHRHLCPAKCHLLTQSRPNPAPNRHFSSSSPSRPSFPAPTIGTGWDPSRLVVAGRDGDPKFETKTRILFIRKRNKDDYGRK